MRLRDLLRDFDVLEWSGDPDVEVTSLTHDSRRVEPGGCFACLSGARTDGHDHAAEAVAAGARSLLVDRMLPSAVSQARVADVRAGLGAAAARCHGAPSRDLRVIGVTGTNGKTTTVALLDAIGSAAGKRIGVVGTLGTRVGEDIRPARLTTPEATDLQATLAGMRAEGVELVAMEVSSHALVRHRVDGTWFSAACFTNLSHDHLDEHGSMEGYFAAKQLLFEPDRTAVAVINLDDPFGMRVREHVGQRGLPSVTFAVHDPDAQITARSIRYGAEGTSFVLVDRRSGERAPVTSRMLGEINVANQLAAAASALAIELPFDAVVSGLEASSTPPGRLERIDGGQPFTVLVDYAHTPDSLARVLEVAALAGSRVIVVFGCGGDRDREKRPMMGAIAARGADEVIVTSDNPRDEDPGAIASEVVAGLPVGTEVTIELDRRHAIDRALTAARAGDVVVVAGKGHETGQTVAGITHPFDDRVVVRELLEERRCA